MVEREYQVLDALFKVNFPVPEPLCLCEDESVIGTSFYLMRFVEGRIFRDPELKSVGASERKAIYNALTNVLKYEDRCCLSPSLCVDGCPGSFTAMMLARLAFQARFSKKEAILSDSDTRG